MFASIDGLEGWRHLALGSVGSTNIEAMNLAKDGDPGQVWVTAEEQLSGKARRGRGWVSKPGNLYASLLLIEPAERQHLATLPLVVSLGLYEALSPFLGGRLNDLKIKWPNDLLFKGKKLSGILLEATNDPQGRLAVVIGCGVNCAHYPDNPLYPATSLAFEGFDIRPYDFFERLASSLAQQLSVWNRGQGIAEIRQQWLNRAQGVGLPIVVRFSQEELHGTFDGIDKDGMLLLKMDDGTVQTISAGDVFF